MTDAITRLTAALSDRYRIERELGEGGMATVYLAEDLKHDRKVAIKVLREDLSASLGGGRFLREIRIAAKLQHPNILPLLDSGDADGLLFFVMPYVLGQSLRERLEREGELPVSDAVRLLVEIVDALAHAHEHGVVHRDIKPDNVMLSGRHALVTDFGVAKAVSEATGRHTVTTLGVAVGTPAYMSPEQATATPNVDQRSDIYAVGALAYEMLTGRPPFVGQTPQQVLAAHVTQAPEPVVKLRPGIPEALDAVIMKCLAKRPADRWQSAGELLAQLEPLATPSVGITPAEMRPLAPRRALWPWLAGAAVLLIAAAGVFIVRRPPRALAVMSTTQLTTEEGLYLDPALSPDGKFIAYAEGAPSEMRIVVRQVEGGRPIALAPGVAVPQRWPQWSPDGQRIAFAAAAGVYVVPALGGTARNVASFANRNAAILASPTWSPDGAHLAYVDSSRVLVTDLATGRADSIYEETSFTRPAFDLRWSPDGRWIAAAVGNYRFAFSIRDLGNTAGARIILIPAGGGPAVDPTGDTTGMAISPTWLPDSRHLLWVSDRAGGRDVYEVALRADGRPAGAPTRITTGLSVHSVSLGDDGRMMAYSSYTPSASVWTIKLAPNGVASSRDAEPLTRGTDVIEDVRMSPDHRQLLVTSNRTGHSNLFLIPVGGGPAVQLTTDSVDIFRPAWSRDGTHVCYENDAEDRIYSIPAAGGVPTKVTDSAHHCDWSADGRTIVVADWSKRTDTSLEVVHRTAAGWGAPVPLAGGAKGLDPEWSPDGKWIAYRGIRDTTERPTRWGVWVVPSGGGSPRLLTAEAPRTLDVLRITWSDDSRELYFRAQDSTDVGGIWSVPLAGGPVRPLVLFDDPARAEAGNKAFSIYDGRVYMRIMQHRSSIGIARLQVR